MTGDNMEEYNAGDGYLTIERMEVVNAQYKELYERLKVVEDAYALALKGVTDYADKNGLVFIINNAVGRVTYRPNSSMVVDEDGHIYGDSRRNNGWRSSYD